MPKADDLLPLVLEPSETLPVEHKSWLDLSDKSDRARLAKAVIALANHGGGTIVVGMREDQKNGQELISKARPEHIKRYSGDDVNGAVKKFAAPAVHCDLTHVVHTHTGHEHAIISVPGDTTVPVLCKSLCEGVIQQGKAYIRKPGPMSEEANTPEEWASLLDRCVQARRADMLDAIRKIVLGQTTAASAIPDIDPLEGFVADAGARWMQLIATLPEDAAARMPLGGYQFAFKLLGQREELTLSDVKEAADYAHRIKLTGWPTFLEISREPYTPRPVGSSIETWLGRPDIGRDRAFSDAHHSDFWRIDTECRFFMKRGFQEDGMERVKPGTAIDITLPIWRVGEALLFVSRFSEQIEGADEVLVDLLYTGLADRKLISVNWDRILGEWHVSHDDKIRLRGKASVDDLRDNLVEVVHSLLLPLYERFNFYKLSRELVAVELERMLKGRF